MTRTWNRAHLVGLLAVTAIGGCKTNVGELSRFLACDDEGQCVDGYRCAQLDIGPTCLDEAEWMQRCGAGETCNGRDDDCDGTIDNGFDDTGQDCDVGEGACRVDGTTICTPDGSAIVCSAKALQPTDEVCDGRDNDCNGETDEELADVVTGTDEGECAVRIERCQDGEFVAIMDGVLPTDEVCNGLDDDCNGVSDDGVPPLVAGATIGECRVTVSECLGGEYVVVITGVDPVLETCNGRDDDCDEDTDEDFSSLGTDCPVGIGACTVIGTFQCSEDGDGVACDAIAGNPGAEVCDDIDNNCDGVVDEIFTELGDDCTVGVGACLASGERVCREDGLGTACDAESADPVAETCNGLDDDCDGVIDNGITDCCIPGMTRACGNDLGACVTGTQTCTPERAWGMCSGQGPVADACNGLDDDCDGEADEELAGCCGVLGTTIPCSVDRGSCVAGVQTCGSGGAWSACSGVLPTTDRCDGDDNDCDGSTDEDFADLEDDCSVDQGACAAFGARVCTEDGLGTTCGAIPGTSTTESCNLVDDDCDGEVDDGLVTYTGTDVGECQQGIERCIDGAIVVVQERFDPVAETCDGLDQDCDGIADDEAPSCCAPGSVRTCGLSVGLCTVGSQTCGADFAWSACSGAGPTPERCDGDDNDCSGVADDQWVLQLGTACVSGMGACARVGVYECNPNFSPSMEGEREGVVCDAVSGDPGTESCNGLDDDCDGSVDETADLPPIFIGSDVGDCEPAVIACVGGTTTEVDPGQGPSPETCDSRDNDCSGLADDGIPSVSCYTGPVGTEGVGICAGGDTACVSGTLLCLGQSLPTPETCDGFDNNCDGTPDGSPGPGGTPVALAQPCYSGPPGTLGNGPCVAGTTTCSDGVWGDCLGEVLPDFERCEVLDGLDNDCDGVADEWQEEMVVVPEGPFLMGSPDGVGSADEHPQHTVTLSRYCMDRYEVTNTRYRACVDAGACDPPVSEDSRTYIGYFRDSTYDQYPVVNVTWYMADVFCQWDGKQLPTEAQWEKAARGTDGRTYPWGEDAPTCDRARFYDCPPYVTVAVDTLPLGASPYGALHMSGNAGEWVADWYDAGYYAVSPTIDPTGPILGTLKVFRSGGVASGAADIRVVRRGNDRVPTDAIDLGVRCAQ